MASDGPIRPMLRLLQKKPVIYAIYCICLLLCTTVNTVFYAVIDLAFTLIMVL